MNSAIDHAIIPSSNLITGSTSVIVAKRCRRLSYLFGLILFVLPSFRLMHGQNASAVGNGPYKKWLDEDVRWIISDQERTDFKALSTDEQRNNFVVTFWDRRNPVSGSVRNIFKEAHYRRLAYANEHFAQGIPGWKTDRGRFYIMYGPPNYIVRHVGIYKALKPGQMQKGAYNSEGWRWKYIEGLGCNVVIEFEDRCECGEYHLTRAENGVGHQENGVTPLRQLGPDCLIDQVLFP
jgi:GWxTD domain-containing protein